MNRNLRKWYVFVERIEQEGVDKKEYMINMEGSRARESQK
jgi:hypothetical protein